MEALKHYASVGGLFATFREHPYVFLVALLLLVAPRIIEALATFVRAWKAKR